VKNSSILLGIIESKKGKDSNINIVNKVRSNLVKE
jgi:hypothetical protein